MRGILDILGNLFSTVGINEETSAAIERALASPTMTNINAVETAFNNAGTSAPPELMQTLYERYAQAVRDNPLWAGGGLTQFVSQYWPLILIGGAALFMATRKGN